MAGNSVMKMVIGDLQRQTFRLLFYTLRDGEEETLVKLGIFWRNLCHDFIESKAYLSTVYWVSYIFDTVEPSWDWTMVSSCNPVMLRATDSYVFPGISINS